MEEMTRGKGNKALQQRNRRRNNRRVPKRSETYKLIDGNESYQPYAYCWYYHGYLTKNQAVRHSCRKRNCKRFQFFEAYQQVIAKYEDEGQQQS